MGARDVDTGMRGPFKHALAGRARLVLVGVELPGHLRPGELDRRDMHDIAPDQQGFAGARDFERGVADLMANRPDGW